MHHCFLIYEILELLCEAVLYRTENDKLVLDRASLIALLKTCRAFNIPATKLLWRSLSSIVPLILTMPKDILGVAHMTRTLAFRRDAFPSDWERFDFYAPFVKHLGTITPDTRFLPTKLDLHHSVCRELAKRDKILLPNLDTIAERSCYNLPLIQLFLGSQIQRIELKMNASQISSFHQPIIAAIPVRVPSIKSLYLSQGLTWTLSEAAAFRPTLSAVLDSLDLEEFHCDLFHLSDHMLETLVRMPRLRKLSVLKDIHSLARVLRSYPLPAPQLKEFFLGTNDGNFGPSVVTEVLVLLRPSQLEEFHLLPGGRGISNTLREMSDLISAIKNNCSPTFLKHFKLEGWRPVSSESPTILDSQLLRPLFAFSNLQSFILAAYPFDFTDAEVKDLAMSWPLIEKLFFDTSVKTKSKTQTRTTMRCLLWFAIYCRNLRSLCFVFNGIDKFSDTEMSRASNHKLSFLSVGYSTITERDKVSTFFNTVFPSIALFFYSNPALDDETQKAWQQVGSKTQWHT